MKKTLLLVLVCIGSIISRAYANDLIEGLILDKAQALREVTEDFTIGGLAIRPKGMHVEFKIDKFELYGAATIAVGQDSMQVLFGSKDQPGLVIIEVGLRIEALTFAVTDVFQLKSLEFAPDSLGFSWNSDSSYYDVFGTASLAIDGDSVAVKLGNLSNPGLIVAQGDVSRLDMTINGAFKLKSFSFTPTDLTFIYSTTNSWYELYGGATFTIDNNETTIAMGTAAMPGLLYQDGSLQALNFAISEDFTVEGLTIKTDSLGVAWNETFDDYHFFGKADLRIDGNDLNVDLGTEAEPGIVYSDGTLKTFKAVLNTDFMIGNLQAIAKSVTVEYNNQQFAVTGEIQIEIAKAEIAVTLGQGNQAGLVVDTSGEEDAFQIDDFNIEVEHVAIGAINLTLLDIAFSNGMLDSVDLNVSFPPGWEVAAKANFVGNPAKLDSIGIDFEATDLESAIEIGATGISIVQMGGGMGNLADPSNLYTQLDSLGDTLISTTGIYFDGSLGFTFGGPVSLLGQDEVALFYQEDDVFISSSELKFDASLLIGAYLNNGTWTPILGNGDVTAEFVWGQDYSVTGNLVIPSSPPLLSFNVFAYLASGGAFDAGGSLTFTLPDDLPWYLEPFEGDCYSAAGAVRYNPNDLCNSYGAAWTCVADYFVGARYDFVNGCIDLLGSCDVSGIEAQITADTTNQGGRRGTVERTHDDKWYKHTFTFKVPPNNTSLYKTVNFRQEVSEAYFHLTGPNGKLDLYELVKTVDTATNAPSTTIGNKKEAYTDAVEVHFLARQHQRNPDDSLQYLSSLTPGSYQLTVGYKHDQQIDSIGFRGTYFYPGATGHVGAVMTDSGYVKLTLKYWAKRPDSTSISVFWNSEQKHNGRHIVTFGYGQPDAEGFGTTEVFFKPERVVHGDSMVFYMVVEDGLNSPYYSPFSSPILHSAPISGQVVAQTDAGEMKKGFFVYIDADQNGNHGTKSTAGAFERSSVTNTAGQFFFNDLEQGKTYQITLQVPVGFALPQGQSNTQTVQYNGQPLALSFSLVKQ